VLPLLIVELVRILLVVFFLILLLSPTLWEEGTLLFYGLTPCNILHIGVFDYGEKTLASLAYYKNLNILYLFMRVVNLSLPFISIFGS